MSQFIAIFMRENDDIPLDLWFQPLCGSQGGPTVAKSSVTIYPWKWNSLVRNSEDSFLYLFHSASIHHTGSQYSDHYLKSIIELSKIFGEQLQDTNCSPISEVKYRETLALVPQNFRFQRSWSLRNLKGWYWLVIYFLVLVILLTAELVAIYLDGWWILNCPSTTKYVCIYIYEIGQTKVWISSKRKHELSSAKNPVISTFTVWLVKRRNPLVKYHFGL